MSDLPKLEETQMDEKILTKRSRRSLLLAALSGGIGIAMFEWLNNMAWDREIPWLLRRSLALTDAGFKATFRKNALAPHVTPPANPIRINGDIGLLENIDVDKYRVEISSPAHAQTQSLSIEDIKQLPAREISFLFKCIEGWSQNVQCKGAHFSDLISKTGIGRHFQDGKEVHYKYASLKSLNGEYYVSMDMDSLLHPQTLLVYEMSQAPLLAENGYPLRLMTAVKYGVKSIKQVASIEFTNDVPKDYWAENGYSDFIGL